MIARPGAIPAKCSVLPLKADPKGFSQASSGTAPLSPFLSEVLPQDRLKQSVLRHNQLSFGELGFPSWTQIVANPLCPCLPSRTVVGSGVNIQRSVERNGFLIRIVPVLHRYCSCVGFILTSWECCLACQKQEHKMELNHLFLTHPSPSWFFAGDVWRVQAQQLGGVFLWTDGCMDRCMDAWIDAWMCVYKYRWTGKDLQGLCCPPQP